MFETKVLFRVDFLCDLGPDGSMPQGVDRGQNLGHLRFFCFYFSCIELFYLNNMYRLGYFSQ